MKNEDASSPNAFRFRRVKWGDPRHGLRALRNTQPVIAKEEAGGWLFWVLTVLLVFAVFGSVWLFYTGDFEIALLHA